MVDGNGNTGHARLYGVALGIALTLAGAAYTTYRSEQSPTLERRITDLETRRGSVPISQEADDRLRMIEFEVHQLKMRLEALEKKR